MKDPETQSGISQANVYFKGTWLGSTDESGILKSKAEAKGRGLLKIIKHGYETFAKETRLGKVGSIEIPLKRVSAYVRVDSEPNNLSVFIDKKFVGKTPLEQAISVPGGFVKLEILGEKGFKNHKEVLELDEGTLDLTGDRRIVLEKDIKSEAVKLVNGGQFEEAIKILESIPPEHSDYNQGQHQAGVIHMTLTNSPAKAAAAFHRVTQNPEVSSFRDKRFIGSHINEGVSLYLTAKGLLEDGEDEAAVAHFRKAASTLEKTEPFIRFIKQSDYQQAFDNLYYYKALSLQEIWHLTQQLDSLRDAQASWQQLLSGRENKNSQTPMLKNANIYLKQLELALSKEKKERL